MRAATFASTCSAHYAVCGQQRAVQQTKASNTTAEPALGHRPQSQQPPLQAPATPRPAVPAAAPRWWLSLPTSTSSTSRSSGSPSSYRNSSSSNASSARVRPLPSELAPALAPLAALCSAEVAPVAQALASSGPQLRQGVLAHGCAVAAYLRRLGCPEEELAKALRRCLLLFSWPVERRAGVLMPQLASLGLLPAEALRCLERSPAAIGAASFEPAIDALAQLFDACSSSSASSSTCSSNTSSSSSTPGGQALAGLLRAQPAAAALLALSPHTLLHHAANLAHLGLAPPQLLAALHRDPLLLTVPPQQLAELEEALQEAAAGAGASAGDGDGGGGYFAHLLLHAPSLAVDSCAYEVEQRALALVQRFGAEGALALTREAPQLLLLEPGDWRRSLAVLQLCWVADPTALARRNPSLLCCDLAAPSCVAGRLALQHCLELSAAGVYERLPAVASTSAAACRNAARLACRLLFLAQQGSAISTVSISNSIASNEEVPPAAVSGSSISGSSISLLDVAQLPDPLFASLLQQHQLPADAYSALLAGFAQHPAWQRLQQEAAVEAARLQRLLVEV